MALIVELTRREVEVMRLVTCGKSNRQIAEDLCIAPGTVKNHITNILHKMGVTDRTQAVVQALQRGWVKLLDVPPIESNGGSE